MLASPPVFNRFAALLFITLATANLAANSAIASIISTERVEAEKLSEGDSNFESKSNNYGLSIFYGLLPKFLRNHVDAPKYYHLNALLYKPQTSRGDSEGAIAPADLRPLKGMRVNPSQSEGRSEANSENSEEEGSEIDSLIKAMRREQAGDDGSGKQMSGVTYGGSDTLPTKANDAMGRNNIMPTRANNIGGADVTDDDLDEASLQRKSTDILDGSSRLRSSRAEPRRKRRAIVRHVPPKLRSRRISKLSSRTRTKLRMKPKRRA